MDKYEYKVRADQIRTLIAEKRYSDAVEIADEIDWRNVKNGMMLCTVSDLYKVVKRYEDARDVLLLAYERNPEGRMIIYSLCELSIKLNDVVNAVEYYKEYLQVAPRDTGRYILQYKLYEAEEVGLEERIAVLEELQKRECKEKWMYELAYLYHRIGLGSSCVDQCNQICIYFGEGKYVIKALELKKLHEELTPEQDALYKRLTGRGEPDIQIKGMDVGYYNTMDLQKELADNLKEVMDGEEAKAPTEDNAKTVMFRPFEVPIIPKEDDSKEADTAAPLDEAPSSLEMNEQGMNEIVNDLPDETSSSISIEVSEPAEAESATGETNDDGGYDQITLITGSEKTGDTAPRMFDRGEIEKALGGSEVVTDDSGRLPIAGIEEMLSLEGDGQLSMVVPESTYVEKQITGQVSIDEAILEWERMKKVSERKWSQDVARRMKDKTRDILKSFDETSKVDYLDSFVNDNLPEGEELTEEEIFIEDEAEPTAEELSFDRSEFVSEGEDLGPEPEAEDNTTVLPDASKMEDYLLKYAQAGEIKDSMVEASVAVSGIHEISVADEAASVNSADNVFAEEKPIEAKEWIPEDFSAENVNEAENEPDLTKEILMSDEDLYQGTKSESDNEEAVAEAKPEESYDESGEKSADDEEYSRETADADEAGESDDYDEITEEEAKEVIEASSAPVVIRETPKGFTDEQLEKFESYIYTDTGSEQVRKALGQVTVESGTGNLIIGSRDKDSSIELAKAFIMDLSTREDIPGKVAKIKASTLNAKDAKETVSKLKNGALIITEANELRDETMRAINEIINLEDMRMFIVLTMSLRHMHNFIMDHADELSSFNGRIEIEPMDSKELVKAAREYAYKREYSIDEMGALALYRRIDEMQTNDHNVTYTEVKELVDEAIRHASKKTVGHFIDTLVGKRYDDNDMIVLVEKDFME